MRGLIVAGITLGFFLGTVSGVLVTQALTPVCRCHEVRGLSAEQWDLAKSIGQSEIADRVRLECNEQMARWKKGKW